MKEVLNWLYETAKQIHGEDASVEITPQSGDTYLVEINGGGTYFRSSYSRQLLRNSEDGCGNAEEIRMLVANDMRRVREVTLDPSLIK